MTMNFQGNGYVPVMPGPLDTAAIWGAAREHQTPDGARPHLSPGRPPWDPQEPKDYSGWVLPIALAALALLILILTGFTLQRQDVLPQQVPLIGKDTGVAACQAIAESGNLDGIATGENAAGENAAGENAAGEGLTQGEYKTIRAIFADSRYPEIRDNGLAMADLAWQVSSMTQDADSALAALPLIGPMTSAYSGLAGACADHGYTIPALGS